MDYLLALDQGTSSSRALVIDSQATVLSIAQKEFHQSFPSPGWVEHDAEEIWSSQLSVAQEALKQAKIGPEKIAAIGITNQRETTVVWDRRTGQPIYPAIVWQDRRTTSVCEELQKKGLEPLFKKKTGLLLDPYFSATKLAWILDHVEGARERAERGELAFGTIDCWLLWKLTEGTLHATDVTNASRTLLFNLETEQWDEELLQILNIPPSLLPEVKSSSEIYGHTQLLGGSIPIGGVAGDQQAALFGQCCFQKGDMKATFGTGCFILMNSGQKPSHSNHHLLSTIAWKIGAETTYALEGTVFIAGAAIQWFRDNLGLIKKSSEIDLLASSVTDTGGVYFVPALTGLGAPHWDPSAQGALFGLSRGTTGAHLARAVLESIAFSAADLIEAMELDMGSKVSEIRVDGGAASSDLLMQMEADFSRCAVLRPKNRELTALGSAMLAGLAVGIWKSQEELVLLRQEEKRFVPKIAAEEIEQRRSIWNRAVELCMRYS